MTPHEMATIARFSRPDGSVPWQSVAAMLGRNAADLRADYDGVSVPAPVITLDPPGIGPVDILPEPECYRSPRPRGDGLRMMIIGRLARGGASSSTLADFSGTTIHSIQTRLSAMKADGVVQSDGRMPYTWTLTEFGREVWGRERGDIKKTA